MTAVYVFVGLIAQYGDRAFTEFGQQESLSYEEATEAVTGGIASLPKTQFDALRIDPKAVSDEDRKRAWLAVAKFSEEIEEGVIHDGANS